MKYLLLILMCPCFLFSKIDVPNDFQIWNRSGFQCDLSKRFSLRYDMEYRYGNDSRELYLKIFEGGAIYTPNQYLQTKLGYRQMYDKEYGQWFPALVPLGEIVLFIPIYRFLFLNRNRLEYRMVQSEGKNAVYLEEYDANSGIKFFLYRNRTTLFSPQLSRKLPINFYLSDEFFCQQGKGLNQNRVLVGLLIPLNQRMSADLFFQKRFLKREGQWYSQNILGTYLNFFY